MKIQVENMPEYNTARGAMLISEYGRNIQNMVAYAVTIQDREKRNRIAHSLVQLMGMINPGLKDTSDFKQKLWDHLFVISDFKLDVDSPFPIPTRESVYAKPDVMTYPQTPIRFRFYGKNIKMMIDRAANMEESPTKAGFINLIGSFMKQSCKNWNEEQLSDEEILSHLELLSAGRIKISTEDDVQFNALQNQNQNRQGNRNFKQGGNNQNQNQNRSFGKNNQNRNFRKGNNNGGSGKFTFKKKNK
ncbi:MAG: DUF4290 domain-containing protein [Bacteroidia bacterium]|jgi:hypothetical protein|nr:DUF4290 domain-containing protein [Bacteroidia bacterium]